MKKMFLVITLFLSFVLAGCGGGSSSPVSAGTGSSGGTGTTTGGTGTSTGGGTGTTTGGGTGTTTGGGTGSTTGTGNSTPLGTASAARLLTQATFGPTLSSLDTASTQTYNEWFAAQAGATPSLLLPRVPNKDVNWVPFWWTNVVNGQDQLRQRMAFALSEILVVSDQSAALSFQAQATSSYYDILVNNSLGNFRTLLEKVTLSPAMGLYLNMFRNDKANPATGVHADQNFAREVMQLFTVGLVRLNIDGSVQIDSRGIPIPTYGQNEVEQMSNALTGWASTPTQNTGENAWRFDVDYVNPMVAYPNHHDTSAKTIIGGVVIPSGGTAEQDLKIVLDTLFNHPNVGPFIASQLIKRLVTSNPSPAYVQRVATVFNNNGIGTRGDLLAVARAILTDPEAVTVSTANAYGKLREPLIRMAHLWRAFSAADQSGNLAEFSVLQTSFSGFAQSVLSAPSVFNFFQPDYVRSGSLALAGLVVPEFQITNENTLVLTNNQLQRQAYQFIDSSGTIHTGANGFPSDNQGATTVYLRTANWEALAADPTALVDRMNMVLMAGTMPASMRSSLIDYATSIPTSENFYRASRVIETADLIINSSQYAVQR